MTMQVSRTQINERFREGRAFLSYIKTCESTLVPPVDTEEVKIIRGMFYVNLYAILEYSINHIIEEFLTAVSSLQLKNFEFSLLFLPTAMNAHFKSIADSQSERKWQKRVDFVNAIYNGEDAQIENLVFGPHLQSCTNMTMSSVLSYIGMPSIAISSNPDRHYIDEIVNKRHAIAHGRTSSAVVGANGRSSDLELRFDAVQRSVDLFISQIEDYYNSYDFINSSAKSRFLT